jgi:hypothetical protein
MYRAGQAAADSVAAAARAPDDLQRAWRGGGARPAAHPRGAAHRRDGAEEGGPQLSHPPLDSGDRSDRDRLLLEPEPELSKLPRGVVVIGFGVWDPAAIHSAQLGRSS